MKIEKEFHPYKIMESSPFALAVNPMGTVNDLRIIHARNPVIIAHLYHFPEGDANYFKIQKEHDWLCSTTVFYKDKLIFIGATFIGELEEKDRRKSLNEQEHIMAEIMSSMGDWYRDYLEWQRKKMNIK